MLAHIHSVGPVAGLADETATTVQSLRAGRPPRYGVPSALLELVMRSVPAELEERRRVLVHNDFSVSNVLVDGGRTTSANFLGPADLTTAQVRKRFNALVETAAASL